MPARCQPGDSRVAVEPDVVGEQITAERCRSIYPEESTRTIKKIYPEQKELSHDCPHDHTS